MNISSSSMRSAVNFDRTDRQLFNSTLHNRFDPTARAIQSNHETDKQVEDNVTWLYEYKALLNSKLTTLTTALSSAYTTDLDISMGAKSGSNNSNVWGKNAMQGLTGGSNPSDPSTTIIDPGAARTAYAYLTTWRMASDIGTPATVWAGNASAPAEQSASATLSISAMTPDPNLTPNPPASGTITGTTTFLSGGRTSTEPMELDRLMINFNYTTQNYFHEDKTPMTGLGPELITTPTDPGYTARPIYIGNNVERTLYKFFLDKQNLDLIRFGLFNDLIVVGTSSLPTGSQTQGSISLSWDQNLAAIRIYQERYAAFFHS